MKFKLLFALVLMSALGFAQQISGNVTGTDGEALISATVRSTESSSIGTVTDYNGDFILDIDDATENIVVSYTGYESKIIPVLGQTSFNVQLKEAGLIEGVTVSVYGKDGETPITGAIAMVSAKDLEDVPIASVDQLLQGKAAGLTALAGSGQPGSAATVRIRGAGSISGSNEPLYILDGIQISGTDLEAINPNDIEVAAVLKDASSTSIYGSRGANGVIVLKTKGGEVSKTKITYSGQLGTTEVGRQRFEMMNANELLAFQELARRGAGWSLSPLNPSNQGLSAAEQLANANELERLRGVDNDWRDIFFRTGKSQKHNLSLRGGNEKTQFFTSFELYKEDGIIETSEFERKSGRLNLTHNVNDKLSFDLKTSVAATDEDFVSRQGVNLANPFVAIYLANPFETLKDTKGNVLHQLNDPEGINRYAGYNASNAYSRIVDDSRNRTGFKSSGIIQVNYDLTKNITISNRAGLQYNETNREIYINPNGYGGLTTSRGQAGSLTESNNRFKSLTINPTVNFNKEIGERHYVNAVTGYEYVQQNIKDRGFRGYGLSSFYGGITPGQITYVDPDSGEPIAETFGGNTESRLSGGFINATYTLDDKYEIGGGVRQDASSRFGDGNKVANFWNVGVKWIADKEEFLANSVNIDRLRARFSIGTSGNQIIGDGRSDEVNYSYLPTLSNGSNAAGDTFLSINRLANPDLLWESSLMTNLGFDFGFFGRLEGSIDLYNNKTSDLYIDKAISGTTGQDLVSNFNAGSVRNRGVELELNGDVLKTEKVRVNIGGNVSYNDNEITDLGGEDQFEFGTSIVKVGLPLGSHLITGWAGVDPATGDPLYYVDETKTTTTSNYNEATQTSIWGTSNAPWIGGVNTSIDVGKLSVYSQFNFASGFQRFNNQTFFQENPNFSQFNLSRVMNNIWRKPGDITDVQRLGTTRRFSSKDIEDASFVRWRNLNASYDLNSLVENVKGINSLKVFGNATNVHTWTKFTGFDPEDNDNIAQYEYPLPRQITLGINLGL